MTPIRCEIIADGSFECESRRSSGHLTVTDQTTRDFPEWPQAMSGSLAHCRHSKIPDRCASGKSPRGVGCGRVAGVLRRTLKDPKWVRQVLQRFHGASLIARDFHDIGNAPIQIAPRVFVVSRFVTQPIQRRGRVDREQ